MDTKIKLADLKKSVFLLKPAIHTKSTQFSNAPCLVTKVTPDDPGMRIKSFIEFCLPYLSVNYISVFGVQEPVEPGYYIDIYLTRQYQCFRIPMESISYENFFPELKTKKINAKFRIFVLNLLKKCAPVFIDEPTGSYLKNNHPWIYINLDEASIYSNAILPQIMFRKKKRCEKCFEIYWEDTRNKTKKKYCPVCKTEKIPIKNIYFAFIKNLESLNHI